MMREKNTSKMDDANMTNIPCTTFAHEKDTSRLFYSLLKARDICAHLFVGGLGVTLLGLAVGSLSIVCMAAVQLSPSSEWSQALHHFLRTLTYAGVYAMGLGAVSACIGASGAKLTDVISHNVHTRMSKDTQNGIYSATYVKLRKRKPPPKKEPYHEKQDELDIALLHTHCRNNLQHKKLNA